MTITLSADLESALTAEATRRGIAPEALAQSMLKEQLQLPEPQDEWERRLSSVIKDYGVSLPAHSLTSEELYD